MRRIDTDIEIDAPIERVWSVLSDLASYEDWNPYLVRMEGRAEPGATIQVTARPAEGDELSYPIEVVAVDPPSMLRVEGGFPDRSQFKGDHRFELHDLGDGRTRLHHWEEFSGTLGDAIFGEEGPRVDFERMNAALKAAAERGTR